MKSLGFSRAYLNRHILPSWFDEEAEQDANLVPEIALLLAKALGLDFLALINPEVKPCFRFQATTQFKLSKNHSIDKNQLARSLHEQLASKLARTLEQSYQPLGQDSEALHQTIQQTSGSLVNFETLLNFCWSSGIPVAPAAVLPKGQSKFTGMVTWAGDRPVIFLGTEHEQAARLLFTLAHELGHCALGHVGAGDSLLESKVNFFSDEAKEAEANAYALGLLTGRTDRSYDSPLFNQYSATEIARQAWQSAEQDQVDPRFIVLNQAWHRAARVDSQKSKVTWMLATQALNLLGESESAQGLLRRKIQQHCDFSELKEDDQEQVSRLLALEIAVAS